MFYQTLATPTSAAAMHHKALEIRELYGDDHPDVAQSLYDFGQVN